MKQQNFPEVSTFHEKNEKGITLTTAEIWYVRLWYTISNPFRYLFTGKIKY